MSDKNQSFINISSANLGNIVLGGALALLTWWISNISETLEESKKTNIKVERIASEIIDLQRWQRDWPTQGELSVDIKQNKDLEFLKNSILSLQRDLQVTKDRIGQR